MMGMESWQGVLGRLGSCSREPPVSLWFPAVLLWAVSKGGWIYGPRGKKPSERWCDEGPRNS